MEVSNANFERLATAELVFFAEGDGEVKTYVIGSIRYSDSKPMAVAVSTEPPGRFADLAIPIPREREGDYTPGAVITHFPGGYVIAMTDYPNPMRYLVRTRVGSVVGDRTAPAGIIVSPIDRAEESVVRWLTLGDLADVVSIA